MECKFICSGSESRVNININIAHLKFLVYIKKNLLLSICIKLIILHIKLNYITLITRNKK